MLAEHELGAYLRQATRSLFRLEALPAYDVPTDRGDFPRYLAGESVPDLERKGRCLARSGAVRCVVGSTPAVPPCRLIHTVAVTGPDNDDRDELSRSLYLARRGAGLGQVEAAKRAGTSQNKVSRVENGKGLLTLAEAEALLTVYSVYGDERRRIMTLVEAAQAGHLDARVILQRGAHHFQERVRQLDEQSRLVRSFAPTVVLGILQTRAYAHVVFTQRMTEEQAAPSVTARVARHRMLDDSSRQWVLLQTEGALRWNLGGSALMVEQIEEITVAIDRPNVRLGIIPWRGVPDYEALFDQLARLAVFDDEARTMLGRITDDYRTL